MKSEVDYSRLVFSPLEVSNATEGYIEEIRANDGDGMPLYISNLDYRAEDGKGFLPVKRGELITVLGRPGNGKTGFMLRWARARTRELEEKKKNSVVLYWTMEQLVEELRLFHVAGEESISATNMANGKLENEDWERVKVSLKKLHTNPLWFAGKSYRRRRDRIKLDENALRGVMDSIEKWQGDHLEVEIDSVFVDYLQRFRADYSRDWVQFYGDLTNALKDMAGDFATRMIVGVQARREVDSRNPPIPYMEDGQWSSSIEQQSDGMISVVRPAHYKLKEMEGVTVSGHKQMYVSVLKRKLGPEAFGDWVIFEPEYNKLDAAEIKHFKLNGDDDV